MVAKIPSNCKSQTLATVLELPADREATTITCTSRGQRGQSLSPSFGIRETNPLPGLGYPEPKLREVIEPPHHPPHHRTPRMSCRESLAK